MAVGVLLRIVCLILGHRWQRGVQTFGHTLRHCNLGGGRRYG
jgi:hypothetical protein